MSIAIESEATPKNGKHFLHFSKFKLDGSLLNASLYSSHLLMSDNGLHQEFVVLSYIDLYIPMPTVVKYKMSDII